MTLSTPLAIVLLGATNSGKTSLFSLLTNQIIERDEKFKVYCLDEDFTFLIEEDLYILDDSRFEFRNINTKLVVIDTQGLSQSTEVDRPYLKDLLSYINESDLRVIAIIVCFNNTRFKQKDSLMCDTIKEFFSTDVDLFVHFSNRELQPSKHTIQCILHKLNPRFIKYGNLMKDSKSEDEKGGVYLSSKTMQQIKSSYLNQFWKIISEIYKK